MFSLNFFQFRFEFINFDATRNKNTRYDNIENRKQQLRKMQFADDVEQNLKAKSSAKSQNAEV